MNRKTGRVRAGLRRRVGADDARRSTRRRLLLAGAAFAFAPYYIFAQQQPKIWRIGILSPRGRPASFDLDSNIGAFLRGMRELGYVEGKNLVIEGRFADGQMERLPGFAAELVRLNVNVIVAAGNQAISAAQKSTTTIPIVIATSIDPVGSGFVKSLAQPGGNITGLSNLTSEISAKHLEMLVTTVPKLSRVAVLVNPTNSAHDTLLKSVQTAAQKIRVNILPVAARTETEIDHAFSTMVKQRVGAVIVAVDGLFTRQARQIAELAAKNRLPSIYTTRVLVEAGGLLSYGQNFADNYYRAATFVDKILKGAKPGDLPVEQSTKFEMVINRKTAKALGLTILPELLLRADRVIE